jgi:hypothetical protein
MRTKSARMLASLIALGLSVGALPAMADKQAVQQAEKQVSDFAAHNGKNSRGYPSQLAYLAGIYIANSMYKEADDAFNKAIDLQKANDSSNSELPNMYTTYAISLLQASADKDVPQKTQPELKDKGQKVLLTGLAVANKFPPASSQKLFYLIGMIDAFRIAGMKKEEQAQIAVVDQELKALESNGKLKPQEIMQVAQVLLRMSGLYCNASVFRAARMAPPKQVVGDNEPDKPNTVKQKNFKSAEAYQLRAMAQYNKLREGDPTRTEMQRNLVYWYRQFGQTKQEEFQTQQLSKLLRTSDRDKLFPQPPPCPACGMG